MKKYDIQKYEITTDERGSVMINGTRIESRKGKSWNWGKLGFMGVKFFQVEGDNVSYFDPQMMEAGNSVIVGVRNTGRDGC